tara:strand:+ start:3632 stop:4036 length:405 start_codon:yes stop_codon:yes gene_type:complete
MKISKSRLVEIIKEEVRRKNMIEAREPRAFAMSSKKMPVRSLGPPVDSDNDGIPDADELKVLDRGELPGNSLDDVLDQLFNLRSEHKAAEQYEVAGFIDEAIDKIERAISSAKSTPSEPPQDRWAAIERGVAPE